MAMGFVQVPVVMFLTGHKTSVNTHKYPEYKIAFGSSLQVD